MKSRETSALEGKHILGDPGAVSRVDKMFEHFIDPTNCPWVSEDGENKTNWFPEGLDIECFVIFLDFYFVFNNNKLKNTLRRSESKQSTRYS